MSKSPEGGSIESRESNLAEFKELARRYRKSMNMVDPTVVVYQMGLTEKIMALREKLGLTDDELKEISREINNEIQAELEKE